MIVAIDPGPVQSAVVAMSPGERVRGEILENSRLLQELRDGLAKHERLAIEMIASYGMPVGREVFETCVWIGRFIEANADEADLVYRRDVKLHICGNPRAKDANIRQALIDKFGGKEAAIGTKKAPGPLYGFKSDMWAALAVAVTYSETKRAA